MAHRIKMKTGQLLPTEVKKKRKEKKAQYIHTNKSTELLLLKKKKKSMAYPVQKKRVEESTVHSLPKFNLKFL